MLIRDFYLSFQQLEFNAIPSSCNKAAKVMASYAKEHKKPSIWIEKDRVSFQLYLQNYLNNIFIVFSHKKKKKKVACFDLTSFYSWSTRSVPSICLQLARVDALNLDGATIMLSLSHR